MATREPHREGKKEFDLVIFGATGFTGGLVAGYLAKKHPAVRWAIAGRSRDKLERLRDSLSVVDPALKELPILEADSLDRKAMDGLAQRTRVVCTTAGPYARYGSALLGACAEHGTDYCDLTGEVYWVRTMIDAHHARAVETGARIVPSCGFDSIPSDLGVFMLYKHLAAQGRKLAEVHFRVTRMKGGASGGTIASGLDTMERMRDPAVRRLLMNPYALNPEGERSGPDVPDVIRPRRDPHTGRWLGPFVMAAVNTRVVRRSNALLEFAYGRDFRYDESMDTGKGLSGMVRAVATSGGLVGGMALAGFPAGWKLIERYLPAPGEGPNREQREQGYFKCELLAVATDGGKFVGRVAANQDPGYGATSWMLSESALCLAEDDLPRRGGILTPASSMGMTLIERLRAAGMTFQVEEEGASTR